MPSIKRAFIDLAIYNEIPVASIVSDFERIYGRDRVARWIRMFKERGENGLQDFAKEEIDNL